MSDLDFWKNKVSKLECECVNKQDEVEKLKSETENLKNEIEKLKCILDSIEKNRECADIAPSREWLEDRHQQDCITINELTVTLNKVIDMYSRLREQVGLK